MKRIIIMFFALAAMSASAATPQVIAHRGYWDAPGASQNSIRSLVKADSIGVYGSEFDVWMTKDGAIVVNHDADINGVCIQNSCAAEVMPQGLKNGEKVPTLQAYLDKGATLATRLVLEMKNHADDAHQEQCVKDIVALVAARGLSDRMEYITFSKKGMLDFIKYAPAGTPVYYLNGDMTPAELKAVGAAGLDYRFREMKKHPEWIAQAHDLGLKVNVWTVNKEEDMKWCIAHGVDFITTNNPELLQKLLKD